MGQRVKLTRRVGFSAGHRYWRNDWTEAQNRERFGRWASPYNHGHNYVLYVTWEGPVNPSHGMVVNIKQLDQVLQEHVVAVYDQKSINDEVPGFQAKSPTLENILVAIRSPLMSMDLGADLVAIRLDETETLYAEWNNDMQETSLTITRVYEFAASHRLHVEAFSHEENLAHFGKCNNPAGHGHNYVLEVTVQGPADPETGMLVNIEDLDRIVHQKVIDRFDHKNLSSDVPEFAGKNPTSEVVAQEIFNLLSPSVPARLSRIRLHETARNIFEISSE